MTWIVLPYPISANRYWATRVITPKGGKRPMSMTYVTPEAEAYRQHVAKIAITQGMRCETGRMVLHVKLFPHRPLDWAKRARLDPDGWDDDVRCIDLGNCEKVLADALQGIAYTDDKQLWDIRKARMEPDEHGERVEIMVERLVKTAIAPQLFAEAG